MTVSPTPITLNAIALASVSWTSSGTTRMCLNPSVVSRQNDWCVVSGSDWG